MFENIHHHFAQARMDIKLEIRYLWREGNNNNGYNRVYSVQCALSRGEILDRVGFSLRTSESYSWHGSKRVWLTWSCLRRQYRAYHVVVLRDGGELICLYFLWHFTISSSDPYGLSGCIQDYMKMYGFWKGHQILRVKPAVVSFSQPIWNGRILRLKKGVQTPENTLGLSVFCIIIRCYAGSLAMRAPRRGTLRHKCLAPKKIRNNSQIFWKSSVRM